MSDDIHPRLRPHASDYAADLLKLGSGGFDVFLPGSSKVIDYLIDQVIPSREQRWARFLTDLSRRLRSVESRLSDDDLWWTPAKQALLAVAGVVWTGIAAG